MINPLFKRHEKLAAPTTLMLMQFIGQGKEQTIQKYRETYWLDAAVVEVRSPEVQYTGESCWLTSAPLSRINEKRPWRSSKFRQYINMTYGIRHIICISLDRI